MSECTWRSRANERQENSERTWPAGSRKRAKEKRECTWRSRASERQDNSECSRRRGKGGNPGASLSRGRSTCSREMKIGPAQPDAPGGGGASGCRGGAPIRRTAPQQRGGDRHCGSHGRTSSGAAVNFSGRLARSHSRRTSCMSCAVTAPSVSATMRSTMSASALFSPVSMRAIVRAERGCPSRSAIASTDSPNWFRQALRFMAR